MYTCRLMDLSAESAPRAPEMVAEGRQRWKMLALIALAELLGMSVWFAANAVAPQLAERWGLSQGEAGWLSTVVQLGFVAGTALAALLNHRSGISPVRRRRPVQRMQRCCSRRATAGRYCAERQRESVWPVCIHRR
jgi:hypothetical protein